MKLTKKLLAGSVAAAVMASSAFAPMANAEVEYSASVGVASSYLWRGYDLGSGTPAVSGDIGLNASGFHLGMWASSGDAAAGTEYDLIIGYGGEVGEFSYDVTLVSYVYPTGQYSETEGIGDFMEAIVSLGYGPVSFSYYDNVAGDTGGYAASEDYTYMTLSADIGAVSVLVGKHDEGADNATHLDLSYAYNDNLSFTLSTIVDSDAEEDKDPFFVVSYSMPIE